MVNIKELPKMERPREKALLLGLDSLTNVELLALLISKGTKESSVMNIAMNILIKANGINDIDKLTYNELIEIPGISKVKALNILAIFELTKRINTSITSIYVDLTFLTNYFKNRFKDVHQEKCFIVLLNQRNQLLFIKELFSGNEGAIAFSSKLVISTFVKYNASKFYIIHNHPLGNPTPSIADIEQTENLIVLALGVNCVFQDHLIFGKDFYFSFKEQKVIQY